MLKPDTHTSLPSREGAVTHISRCPFAAPGTIVQTMALKLFGIFPVINNPEPVDIEGATEKFIKILIQNKVAIQDIAISILQKRFSNKPHTEKEKTLHDCLVIEEYIVKILTTAFREFVCNVDNKAIWEGFSQDHFAKCLLNYSSGLEFIGKLFLALMIAYKRQFGEYPSPEKLEKMKGNIVNISYKAAQGPLFYSSIMRGHIREAADYTLLRRGIFFFDDKGDITLTADALESMEESIDTSAQAIASHDGTEESFMNRHCRGLKMISKLSNMITDILIEIYTATHNRTE